MPKQDRDFYSPTAN